MPARVADFTRTRQWRVWLVVLLSLGLVGSPGVLRAAPATLVVTSDSDSGTGSLRAQVIAAASGDTITFDPGLSGKTITLTSGEIPINKNLTIQGLGANKLTISGGDKSRIFNICIACGEVITVNISGLTLTHGNAGGDDPGGGAILNTNATLNLTDMTFTYNSAGRRPGPNAIGGALDNEATANNQALGIVTIERCTFDHNTSQDFSGAIEQRGAKLTIINSTLTANSSPGSGGANGYGGAIRQNRTTGPIPVTFIINSTIVGNSAQRGGNISSAYGSIYVRNSIIADGKASSGVGPDMRGTITSQDYNWFGNPAGADLTGTTTHDITGSSPGLLPLADNGGPTQTMKLPAGSKAIDAIPPKDGCNGAKLTLDQRSMPRPYPDGGNCDMGAYEVQAAP